MSAEVDTVSYTVLVPADVKLYKKLPDTLG